jgi:hypothetical protein
MSTTAQRVETTSIGAAGFAAGGAVLSAVLTGYGTFKEDNLPGDLPGWLFVNLPIIAITTVLVFAVFVRRALRRPGAEPPARTALVLSLLAVASIVIAYLGLNCVLAAAALCTALAARRRAGRWTAALGVAVALSAVAVGLAVVFAIIG